MTAPAYANGPEGPSLYRANREAWARAARRPIAIDPARKPASAVSVGAYCNQINPTWRWDWPHLRYIAKHLDAVTRGDIKRLMLFLPPRHGKSELTTVRYPVYRLERDPTMRVIVGAYNDRLARSFSRKARRIATTRIELSDERTAVEEWETTSGGGIRAVGVGSGVTGTGGDLVIIDDPVKNREEAESSVYRDHVWEWYTDDLYTRLEPGAAMILIMTRWHEDDLAGRILASDDASQWTVISLPALAEQNDPLGRKPGRALCPDRYDEDALESIRSIQGEYAFSALYQQRPTPRSGEMIDPAWFEIVDAAPAFAQRVRWWDLAATDSGGDFTVGARVSKTSNGIYYIEHIERGQWKPGDVDKHVRQTAELDGRTVVQWGEQEPGSSGKSAAAAFVKLLAGFTVQTEPSTGDKVVRAMPFAAQGQAGNVKMVRGDWNKAFLDEARSFPRGRNDDQIDAVSAAFNKLADMRPRKHFIPASQAYLTV